MKANNENYKPIFDIEVSDIQPVVTDAKNLIKEIIENMDKADVSEYNCYANPYHEIRFFDNKIDDETIR